MKIYRSILFMLVLIAVQACSPASSSSSTAGQAGGQSAEKPAAAGCENPYYPVKNGATWEYELTGSMPGNMTRSLDDVTEKGFSVQETIRGGAELSNGWTCDRGNLTMAAINMEGFTTLTSKGVSLPADLKEGTTWSQELVYGTKTGDIEMTTTMTNTCTAKGTESVTVPAGTFDALRVECTLVSSVLTKGTDTPTTSEVANQSWYTSGVGMVKSKNSVSGYESEYLLKSYKIP